MSKSEETKKNKDHSAELSEETRVNAIINEYNEALKAMGPTHDSFTEKENIFMGTLTDSISANETESKVYDPTLQTAILKQNNDVCAQLPSGQVKTISRKFDGLGSIMGMILEKYIIPNANDQYDVYTKFWLLSLMRKIYGSYGVLVDYSVNKSYIGPTFSLIPARSLIPQLGRYSIKSSDKVYIRSNVNKLWFEQRDKSVWKNIDKVLAHPAGSKDSTSNTSNEQKNPETLAKDDYEIVTMYERDKWTTFSPDAKVILREIDNPQDNHELPVVMCHAFPLPDRFFGLGEIERGKTLHLAQGSLINLYLDGVKSSIFPAIKIDLTKVIPSTITREPGARWIVKKDQMAGAIDQVPTNPAGMNTFQSTYGFLKGAVLGLTNTTDTSVSQSVDVGMGKTPQALRLQEAINGSRINFDRKMLETSIEEVYDKMIDLLSKRQQKPIKFDLFGEEAERYSKEFKDIVRMFKGGAEAAVDHKMLKDHKFKFFIDASSTMKKSDAIENETLTSIIGLVMKLPGAIQQIGQTGQITIGKSVVHFDELLKRFIITSGTGDWDKIITSVDKEQNGPTDEVPQDQVNPVVTPNVQEQTAEQLPPQASETANFEQPNLAEAFSGLKDERIKKVLGELVAGYPNGNSNS